MVFIVQTIKIYFLFFFIGAGGWGGESHESLYKCAALDIMKVLHLKGSFDISPPYLHVVGLMLREFTVWFNVV